MLAAVTLCLLGWAPGAAALHAAARPRGHHPVPGCRCVKHRHCPHAGAKAAHRRAQCKTAKHAAPAKSPAASSQPAPWTTFPTGGVPAGPSPSAATAPAGAPESTPPVESPTLPAGPARVEVTAEDTGAFRFVLSRPSVPAGRVIIEFVNHGQDEHNLNAVEAAEGTLAGSIPNTQPNAHPSLTLTLRPGSYTLFCSIADHEAKGMKATLVVN